jgi:hypothetical protein
MFRLPGALLAEKKQSLRYDAIGKEELQKLLVATRKGRDFKGIALS